MIIYAFLKIVGKHWKRVLLLLITILLFQWIQGIVVNSFLAYKIGQPMQSGINVVYKVNGKKKIPKNNTASWQILFIPAQFAISDNSLYINTNAATFSKEYTYYVADSMFWNMASCTIPIGLAFIIRKNKKIMLLYSVTKNAKTIFLLCIGVVGALIVLCCHTIPRSDQIEIIKAAQGLKQNDFTMFKVGGYLQMSQNQSGHI